jgi:TolB-like protein/DNA-binding winged helix-turn-helix (wHTH) protein/Tfp pilus assembly protein PilF
VLATGNGYNVPGEQAGLADDFTVGNWLVSPALNEISGNGKGTRVEPKAMQVLVYLARNPGVINKDQLIGAVWPDVFVSEDALPGCVSALRKAFGDNARHPQVIETIHKGGYRLLLPVQWTNRTDAIHSKEPPAPRQRARSSAPRYLAITAIAGVVAVSVGFLAWTTSRPRYDSVAVLPFVNAGNDPEAAYLSDGIAEGVINDLSEIPKLKVMAWTTVSRFRDPQADQRSLGRQLGVKSILTGRLLRQGDRLVIQTELVDVTNGSELWGQRYDRTMANIVELQQQLSRDIGANLRVRLTGAERKKVLSRYSASANAYQLYLKGRFFWNQRSREGLLRAIDSFEQAIQIDPHYAMAYAGLADCYNLLDDWGRTLPRDSFPKARAAAERALALDDSLAEAHTSLAMVREAYDWDWAGAELEYQRAIELNPNYATAHQWYGMHLAAMRRFAEAEAEVKRAQELDSLSPVITMAVGEVYAWERRYDDAIVQYRRAVELNPAFAGAYANLSTVYEQKKMYPEAIKALTENWILSGDPEFAASIQDVYSQSGYPAVLQHELTHVLQQRDQGQYQSPIGIAEFYAVLGDTPNALKWLEKGYQEHSSSMQYLGVTPGFDQLRSSPHFQYWTNLLGLSTGQNPSTDKRAATSAERVHRDE